MKTKSNRLKLLYNCCLIVSLGLNVSATAFGQQCSLDPFTAPTTLVEIDGANPPANPKSASVVNASILGGEADIWVSRTVNGGTSVASHNGFPGGVFSFSNSSSVTAISKLTYDGVDGSSNLNPTGLGGLNMSGNSDGFQFNYNIDGSLATPHTVVITIRIYTDAGNWSSQQQTITQFTGSSFIPIDFPRASFTLGAGTGVNWENVGAIEFEFDGTVSPAIDMVIKDLRMPCYTHISLCTLDPITAAYQFARTSTANPNEVSVVDAGITGGEADLWVETTTVGGGTDGQYNNAATPNTISLSNQSNVRGRLILTYDGVDGSSTLNPTGLGGLDMSGNSDGFQFNYNVDDPVAGPHTVIVTLRVYTDAGNWSTQQLTISQSIPVGTFILIDFPRAGFTTGAGTGVNWANIGAIQYEFDATQSADVDLQFKDLKMPCFAPPCVKPNAGTDQAPVCVGNTAITTATLAATTVTNGAWSQVVGNPAGAVITTPASATSGVTGLAPGIYNFIWATSATCSDTVKITIPNCACVKPNAGTDIAICLPKTTTDLVDAPSGTQWVVDPSNATVATITATTGVVTGMTAVGTYQFILQTISSTTCADTMKVVVTNGDAPNVLCKDGSTSVTLTAPSNITNVKWYSMDGTEVGTGNSLVVTSNTGGLADGTEAYYYKGVDGTASGCDVELCCPVKFLTQDCCPTPNCAGVTVIKN